MFSIEGNIKSILRDISLSSEKSVCKSGDVSLVCVTKTIPAGMISEAISAGVKIVGESRVEEALEKYELLPKNIEWHMIGHLQTRKVKEAIKIFDLIHSVDTLRLAEEIDKRAGAAGKIQDILLEVNIAEEESKYGFKKDDVITALREMSRLKNIRVLGLMTMAPLDEDPEKSRPVFRGLRELSEAIKKENITNILMKHLSMGMSQDYGVAVEEGATLVRIGSAVFKEGG